MFDNYILILQCVTIITGLFCLWRKGPVLLWIILTITIVALVNEHILVGNVKGWWDISRNVFYNLYALLDITAWSAVLILIFRGNLLLKILVAIFWCCLITVQVHEMAARGMNILCISSLTWFCVGCILFSTVYFTTVLKAAYYDLKKQFAFWICCASFCFHSVLLVNLLTVSNSQYWLNDFATITFDILQFIALTFYNLFICIAFILAFYKSRHNSSQTL